MNKKTIIILLALLSLAFIIFGIIGVAGRRFRALKESYDELVEQREEALKKANEASGMFSMAYERLADGALQMMSRVRKEMINSICVSVVCFVLGILGGLLSIRKWKMIPLGN